MSYAQGPCTAFARAAAAAAPLDFLISPDAPRLRPFDRPGPYAAQCRYRAYPLFYMLILGWQSFVLLLLGLPWVLLIRRLPVSPTCLRWLDGLRCGAVSQVS